MRRSPLARQTPLRRATPLKSGGREKAPKSQETLCPQGSSAGAKLRSAPMPRATKPIRSRNQARRPSAAASLQRELVLARAGNRCEFEVEFGSALIGFEAWGRCSSRDRLQTCHIWRRRHHNAASVYVPEVALAGCEAHHHAWDNHNRTGLRLPAGAEERARAAINAAAKTPEGRLKPGEMP